MKGKVPAHTQKKQQQPTGTKAARRKLIKAKHTTITT
jgi:hypothetical protein